MKPLIYELKGVKFKFKETGQFAIEKMLQGKGSSTQKTKEFELGPLNLGISKGKFTSILGRSGSGKTTLLSLLGLLRKKDEGEITINLDNDQFESVEKLWKNYEELELFRAQQIGFALQRGELLPHLTIFENAMVVSNFLNKDQSIAKSKILKLSEELFNEEKDQGLLENILNSKPANVSQGQYQRGAMVRALANEPLVVLADEPTGNLDEHTGEVAMKTLRNAIRFSKENNQNETSVIVVTHDIKLAISYADEIIVLKNGKVVGHFNKDNESLWSELNSDSSLQTDSLQEKILEIL